MYFKIIKIKIKIRFYCHVDKGKYTKFIGDSKCFTWNTKTLKIKSTVEKEKSKTEREIQQCESDLSKSLNRIKSVD